MAQPTSGASDVAGAIGPTYLQLVRLLTLYTGGESALAEELAQEAMVRAWQRRDEIVDLSAWSYRCGLNLARSTFHRRAAERRALDRMARQTTEPERETDPIAEPLLAAVQALPRRQREAVLLRYLAELSVASTAQVMSCAEGTVKAHTSKGLASLRQVPELREIVEDAGGTEDEQAH